MCKMGPAPPFVSALPRFRPGPLGASSRPHISNTRAMASRAGPLKLTSTVSLNAGGGGHVPMPLLGFGMYKSTDPLATCRTALETGYRHIDTARAYRNEEAVAEALQRSGLPRSSVFLTTKVVNSEHGYQPTTRAVDESVERLGGPWDLFLVHDPTAGKKKRIETWRALADAQKAGKVKAIGVSNFGVKHLEELEAAGVGPTPAINQIELHPWCQQEEIVGYCREKGIVVQAYCPIARGVYMDDPTLTSIAKKTGKTPAQIMIRWALQSGFVPLPKSDTPHRIKENADVYDFELDGDDMKRLTGLDKGAAGSISWNPVNVA